MNLTVAAFAVILVALLPTEIPEVPILEPAKAESTEKQLQEAIEKFGKEIGCFPRDFMPAGDYRIVVYICNYPKPPEAVIFKTVGGFWRGVRAIFPDLDNQIDI